MAPSVQIQSCFVLVEHLTIPDEEGIEVNLSNVPEKLQLSDASEGNIEQEEAVADPEDDLRDKQLMVKLDVKLKNKIW